MKTIDLNSWPRLETYSFYKALDYPHFSVCADVDVTKLHEKCKKSDNSIFKAVLYGVSLTANTIEEFRYRIRGREIVVHDVVHPSFTVLTSDKLFTFCESKFTHDMDAFFRQTEIAISKVKKNPSLRDEPGRDDYLFISSIPWIRFTSVTHPIHMHPADSVPRLAWGKISEDNNRILMPLSVQVHHGLADGYHVGQFYEKFQEWADRSVL
ncbi:MAG: chloramphenicol acetyltransferase [Desulfobacteraceae bacterium]|nr:chloramphenicol acetyltransferase [Desulfobacteraceae bacterium]